MTHAASTSTLSAALILAMVVTPTLARADDDRGHHWNGNSNQWSNNPQQNWQQRNWRDADARRESWHHEDRRRDGGNTWSGYNNGYGRSYGTGWNNQTNAGRFFTGWGGYNSGWGSNWSGNGYGGYDSYYRRGRSNGDTVALGVGLGIIGLAVAAAASSGKSNRNRTTTADRGWYDPDDQQRNDQQTYRRNDRRYAEPAYDDTAPPAFDSSCLQTREYQTTIIVGGKRERAYGTACLQPDGTWRQGPPILEPR